jgi:hypothetical protein
MDTKLSENALYSLIIIWESEHGGRKKMHYILSSLSFLVEVDACLSRDGV